MRFNVPAEAGESTAHAQKVVDQHLGAWAAEIRARAKTSRGDWQGACEAHGWSPATSMQRRQAPRIALALRVGPGLRPMRRCNAGPGVKPGLHAAPSLGLKPGPTRVRTSAALAPSGGRLRPDRQMPPGGPCATSRLRRCGPPRWTAGFRHRPASPVGARAHRQRPRGWR